MDDTVLSTAAFDRRWITYSAVVTTIALACTVFGCVLIPLLVPLAIFMAGLQLKHMECDLTTQHLRFKTGALNRVEKTIPLDKITDMALVQGPVMRAFGIESLRVETAGGSQGALATVPAVIEARAFRDRVLERRDLLVEGQGSVAESAPDKPVGGEDVLVVLKEIRDSLRRLEDK